MNEGVQGLTGVQGPTGVRMSDAEWERVRTEVLASLCRDAARYKRRVDVLFWVALVLAVLSAVALIAVGLFT